MSSPLFKKRIESVAYPSKGHSASYHGKELRKDELRHLQDILPGTYVERFGMILGKVTEAWIDSWGRLVLKANVHENLDVSWLNLKLVYGIECPNENDYTASAITEIKVTLEAWGVRPDLESHIHYIKEGEHTIRFTV